MKSEIAPTKFAHFTELARGRELIFGDRSMRLPHVCVYNNIAEFNPAFAAHMEQDIYQARDVTFPAIELLTLPSDVIVHPDHDFVATFGNVFSTDQFLNEWRLPGAQQLDALHATTPLERVEGPCLLVPRFGYSTWGHWLGEQLPRAIVAEAAAPGKFRYAMPAVTTNLDWDSPLPRNVLGSLRAYGIGEDRLLRLHPGRRYHFTNLSAVSDTWIYPYAIHPAVLGLIRHGLCQQLPRITAAPRAAMLRLRGHGRGLRHQDEIAHFLQIRGFNLFDIGNLPFIDQVAVFAQAESVFGVLGSNLTGLLYAPIGVQTLAVAPGDWGNCFFHGILQGLEGRFADLRGAPEPGAASTMVADFTIPLPRLTEALQALACAA